MGIQVSYVSRVSVIQTLTGDYVNPDDATVTTDQLSESATYTAGTDVPVTKHAAFQQALTAGAATIDLTALPGLTGDETVDGTGLKVQVAKFRNLSTNANDITVTEGASNGYELLGSAFTFILKPGQSLTLFLDDAAPDIASGARTIDVSGTGTQELECHFVMG